MGYNWDYLDKKAYNNKVGQYKYKRQFRFIKNNGRNNFDKILDIAGGSGRFAIPLSKFSNKITVLDLNADALQLVRQRESSIDTINGDFLKTEINDTFSLILCIEALGYFQNWEAFFNKVRPLILDDGRFIFTYQNPGSWRFQLRKLRHWKKGPAAYNEMDLSQFKKLLNTCDFEIEKMEGMNWIPLPLSSNSKLVFFFEKIEKILRFTKWYTQSPWILFSIKKSL